MDRWAAPEVTLLAGDGAALVGGHAALVLRGAGTATLSALWQAVRTEGDVLGALVRSTAWELPGLAAAWLDGDRCTVLVRGSGTVVVTGPSPARRTISGPAVSTWLEDTTPPGACLDLRVDIATAMSDTPFRLRGGCVPAGGLTGWSPQRRPGPASVAVRAELDRSQLLGPPITPAPVRLRRELSIDGAGIEPVDGPLVLGRRPPMGHLIDGAPARPIALADPHHALSRHHAEIHVDGDRVALVDRGSVNGTTVLPPGGVPRRLEPGVAFVLGDGTVIQLGGAVTLRYAVTRT